MKKWFQIQNKAGEPARIDIYDQIGKKWHEDGPVVAAKEFITELNNLDASDIDLHINSPGGDVFEGLAIYNALKFHKAKITVYIDGLAASISSVVAMAGNRILMPENAMLMIHLPSAMVWGTSNDMKKMANALNKIKSSLVTAYRSKSGQDDEKISDLMTEESWFTAQEAIDLGFADEILEPVSIQNSLNDLKKFGYRNVPSNLTLNRPATNQPLNQSATNQKGNNTMTYENLIKQAIARGLSHGDAIRDTVQNHPEAHADWLNRINQEQTEPERPQEGGFTDGLTFDTFENAVSHYKNQGKSIGAAISTAARNHQNLHEAYLRKVNGL